MPRTMLSEEAACHNLFAGVRCRETLNCNFLAKSTRLLEAAHCDFPSEVRSCRQTRSTFSSFLGGGQPNQAADEPTQADLEKLLSDMSNLLPPTAAEPHTPGAEKLPDVDGTLGSPQEPELDDRAHAGGLNLGMPAMPTIPAPLPGSSDATKLMEYWTFTDQYGDGGAGDHAPSHNMHHSGSLPLRHSHHHSHQHDQAHGHHDKRPLEDTTAERPPPRPPQNIPGPPVATVILEEEDTGFHPIAALGGMMAVFGQVYVWASVFVTLFKRDRPTFGGSVAGNTRSEQQAVNAQASGAGAERSVAAFSGASGQAATQTVQDA